MKSLLLLDHNGRPQRRLYGGELIFSKVSTKQIVEAAAKGDSEEDLYRLGKIVYEERKRQIKREKNETKRHR